MATGGGGGGGSGETEFYRVFVTGLSAQSNREMLVRTRLQNFPGEVVNVHTQGTTGAVATLQCLRGHSHQVPPKLVDYSDLGGSPLTVYKLGTEITTLHMENVPHAVTQELAQLAPAYDVTCSVVQRESGLCLCLSGLIDSIYNLRSEVDAALMWTATGDVSKAPQPAHTDFPNSPEGAGYVGVNTPVMHNTSSVNHVAPPPGMPAHVQPVPFRSSSSATPSSHVPSSRVSVSSVSSTATNVPQFNPKSPLRPSVLNAGMPQEPVASTTPGSSVHSSTHKPTTLPAGSDPTPLADSNRNDFSTPPSSPSSSLPPPIVMYKPDDPAADDPVRGDPAKNDPADDRATGTSIGTTHTGAKSTSPSDPASVPAEERNNVFTKLNPDALALLQRLPEGDIPGVEYNTREGYVRIQFPGGGDVEEAISKFQDAYKKVAVSHSRRLRAENVVIPGARSKEEVEIQIAKFEQQYVFCAFVFDEENWQVKVISQSRQFEQAKQFLSDALQQPLATSAGSNSVAASSVITLQRKRKLTLKRADIVQEKADILVNAANGRLVHGGGVAGALNAASQGKLQKYCNRYMETKQKWKEVPVGEVAVTHGGGELKCFHVIHAVGPDSSTHSSSESEHLVKKAILNTLKAAEKYNVTSIALPALSCGIFGVSKDLVARSMIDAIVGFHFSKPPPTLSDIRIVIIDEPTHSCFARYFEQKARPSKSASKKNAPAPDRRSLASKPAGNDDRDTFADGIILSLNDFPWIMPFLRTIARKWKEIVMKLGVQNDHIMAMMEGSSDEKVLLNRGMSKWLQQVSPAVTLAALVAALNSPEVGEREVASQIVKAGLQKKKGPPNDLSDVKYPSLPPCTEDGASTSIPNRTDCKKKDMEVASSTSEKDDECPICLENFKTPMKTKCGHMFCKQCIEKALQYDPYCPNCKEPLRPITGKQPLGGTMTHFILGYSVPGYEGCSTIQINYTIPSGVQGPEHPNPGQPYTGTSRTAYLPDNPEGRAVLQLLRKAFQARMIFTIGTSVTTGAQNAVVWNDIHHKTNISGGLQSYGYPDPTYLQRVREDLAVKGIVLGSPV